jgi:glycine cleavage system H protein
MRRADDSTYPFWIEEQAGEDRARIGLTEDFLEGLESEPVALELASPGSRLERGATLGFLHTGTGTIDLTLPFAIEIVAINEEALADPLLVRRSPYGRGWLAQVRPLERPTHPSGNL